MAHDAHDDLPPARHVTADINGGWPVAIGIIVLAVVINLGVWQIHERTSSRHPIDPEFRAAGSESHGGSAESHGAGEGPGQGGAKAGH